MIAKGRDQRRLTHWVDFVLQPIGNPLHRYGHLLALHALESAEPRLEVRIGQHSSERFLDGLGALPGDRVDGPRSRAITPIFPWTLFFVHARQQLGILGAAPRIVLAIESFHDPIDDGSLMLVRQRS